MSSLRDLYVKVDIQDGATAPLNSINGLINQIVNNLQHLGNSTSHSLNSFQHMNTTIAQLTNNLSQATQQILTLNNRLNAAENEMQSLRVESQRMENELHDAQTEMGLLRNRLDQAEHDAQQLREEMQRMAQSSHKANGSMIGLGSTLRGMIGLVGTVFAVDKIKDFAVSGIETAAGMKALNAQFGQVFEGMESTAETNLNSIAQKTGILPERLKDSFVQIAAFAKTTGADTAGAMSLAERATKAAADSAAFLDRDISDVTENLQSLLKGNFENDSALGFSATETTRNMAAMDQFGKKFKDLSEAQKQLTLLTMFEDANKTSGALDMAEEEADGFENVIGNLKGSWDKLKGSMMNPFLDTVTGGLQGLSAKLSSIDGEAIGLKLKKGFDLAKDVISSLVNDTGNVSDILQNFGLPKETSDNLAGFANIMRDSVATGIDIAKASFEQFKSVMGWALDNQQLLISGLSGIAAGFAALKVISVVNGLMAVYQGSAFASMVATQGLNAALRANPIGLVVTAIGLLVAAGVYLYQNWDTVKLKAGELWSKTKEVFGGIYDWGMQKIQPVTSFFQSLGDKFNDFKTAISNFKLPDWVSSVGGAISSGISKLTGGGGNAVDGSHATGLASVPYDGYTAELHKGEAVLTAQQTSGLRSVGILSSDGGGKPVVNLDNGGDGYYNNVNENYDYSNQNSTTNKNESQITVPIQVSVNGSSDNSERIVRLIKERVPNLVRQVISDILDEDLQTL